MLVQVGFQETQIYADLWLILLGSERCGILFGF
jgi:hypothetical protein